MTISAPGEHESPDEAFGLLRSAKSSSRLNQIEQIRANGVGELISLPQLVVCGDQSAGKSSVLEGITGIPFPRQDGLCTRFPTEIILRHCNTAQAIVATMRPHSSRSQEVQQTLKAYRKDVKDLSELPSIINDVSKLMGLRGFTDSHDDNAFASDALRIEISGPIGLHLSVVDLPGLISVSNEEQSDDDVDAVRDMVASYLQNSRTIVLSVLQASNDIANQGIIKLARQFDPDGGRTVGIITKPDLINEGTESKIARVAKNLDNIKLRLGFFLLKNLSPSEIEQGLDMDARSRRELQFFASPPWVSQGLDTERIGAEKLRIFLQELLDTHIEKELPKVKEDIRKSLEASERELQALGEPRPTVGHIRAYLIGLSMRFTEIARAALDGNYHGNYQEFFTDSEDSRLRARVQQLNTAFATEVRENGQKRRVKDTSESQKSDNESTNDADGQITVSNAEMTHWVKQAYVRTKGKELPGNYNSALLGELFLEQSQPWLLIAKNHVDSVFSAVSRWVDKATDVLFPEEKIRREIRELLQDWMQGAREQASNELDKLIQDEKRSPLTYNHYYTDNVQKARLNFQRIAIKDVVAEVTQLDWHGKLHIPNSSVEIEKFVSALQARVTVNMDEQACNEAVTELNAYYKVAMKTFVDNVARQVIERHIISSLPTAFCPNNVSQMPDEVLLDIGSEPQKQILRRQKLAEITQGLRQSLTTLQK
ncbi:Interferon-induced GTP-binding protein Mx2 [Fusarium oxysporum f. sp. cubense race 1]|uniref:Interferon-induced GTP-binding protein Mx2 n=1 Tax=Fusarium oxysporum f. sp. cubense (strain race 1) TaxID=1229664 RepID=N4UNX7_FUSC1|nr:Interferon-induced GTP-binding protein Mx2 [Fusarium oxysporum f. sp. cubense race 1]